MTDIYRTKDISHPNKVHGTNRKEWRTNQHGLIK